MNVFYSKENLLFTYDIFTEYMGSTYEIQIDKLESPQDIKKRMFDYMYDIQSDPKNKSMKNSDKNILLLSKTKQHYIKHFQIDGKTETKKPNIQNLSRDKDIYGNRQVILDDKRPLSNPYSRKTDINMDSERSMLDRYQRTRDEEVGIVKVIPDTRVIAPLDKDQPESQEEFFRKMKEKENDRMVPQPMTMEILDSRLQTDIENLQLHSIENQDPKSLYSLLPGVNDINNNILDNDTMLNNRSDILIPRNQIKKKKLEKYITINSFDRNWKTDTMRYQYSVLFHSSLNDADSMSRYRDIHAISISKIVIPEEVFSTNSILNQVKKVFNYEFSFSYPYLLLFIDEFSDIYDGTNQHIRKAFATLIYHRHYKAPNGRGYVILKPIQKEKKLFFPSPLTTLSRLSLKITKPNGDLFNDSADNYRLFKIEYEVFNPQYVKVVTDTFFDKNEFYIGDVINIQGFRLALTDENGEIVSESQDERDFTTFINRASGHEIRDIGQPNDNGFHRSFFIEAPGEFNKIQGKFNVHMNQINALNTYTSNINWLTHTQMNGFILNSSLQNSISMTLDILVDDSSVV